MYPPKSPKPHDYNPEISFLVHLQKYGTRPGTITISAEIQRNLTVNLKRQFQKEFHFHDRDVKTNNLHEYRFQCLEESQFVSANCLRTPMLLCAEKSTRIRTLRYTAEDFGWIIPQFKDTLGQRTCQFEILTRNWVDELQEQEAWNSRFSDLIYEGRPRWDKYRKMKYTAINFEELASRSAGNIKIEQKFYIGSPSLRFVLFDDDAIFLSHYGVVEPPNWLGGSRYKGTPQDSLFFTTRTLEGRSILEWCIGVFNDRWRTAISLEEMKQMDLEASK